MCESTGFTAVASARVVVMISQLEADLGRRLELGDVPHGCCIRRARQIAAF